MRHKIAGNKLGRHSGWRAATVRDVAKATLINQRICTTKAKAKEARKLVDRLITLGKKGALAHRRRAFAILCDHTLVSELFEKTAPRFRERNGGYTRIIPLATLRRGDAAQLAYLELTEKDASFVSKVKASSIPKVKDLSGSPADVQNAGPVKAEVQSQTASDTKAAPGKPGKAKPFTKPQATEKGKAGKKIVGGIKKMFQRKTGSE